MSEEEKRTKKQKIEDNRRLRALSQTLALSSIRSFTPSSSPSIGTENEQYFYSHDYSTNVFDDDLNTFDATPEETLHEHPVDVKTLFGIDESSDLKRIDEIYIQAMRLNVSVIKGCETPCQRDLHHLTDLINELGQMSTLRMITFLKLTPEFHVRCFSFSDLLFQTAEAFTYSLSISVITRRRSSCSRQRTFDGNLLPSSNHWNRSCQRLLPRDSCDR